MAIVVLSGLLSLLAAANPYLNDGRALYEQLRFDEAIVQLQLAREVPTSTREERRVCYDLLARAEIARGRLEDAERAYHDLLAQDWVAPGPRDASPKIQEAFLRAKRSLFPEDFVSLQRLPAPPGRLELALVDPWAKVARLELEKANREGPFHAERLERGTRVSGNLELPEPGDALRWYVNARGADDQLVTQLGSAAAPFVINGPDLSTTSSTVTRPQPRPRWLTPVLAGLSAAAVVVGGGFAVAAYQQSRAGDPSSIPAIQTRMLDARAHSDAWSANFLIGGGVALGAGTVAVTWLWK